MEDNKDLVVEETNENTDAQTVEEIEDTNQLEEEPVEEQEPTEESGDFQQGDSVTHPRYGRGVVEKIIKYGNKTLCSISFENVGRRLLDPTISELKKL